jgi:2-dehydropantoate 2-reductase
MKIVVYGASSIGCYIGAILVKQNLEVTLLGRERILKTIQKNGGVGISDYEGRVFN